MDERRWDLHSEKFCVRRVQLFWVFVVVESCRTEAIEILVFVFS